MSSQGVSCFLVAFSVFAAVCAGGTMENVALDKQCNMSTYHYEMPNSLCQRAVNGDTDGLYQGTNNCIHTREGDPEPWFAVDLGRTFPIMFMTLWARNDYVLRMANCIITVDGVECFRCPEDTKSPFYKNREMNVTCTAALEGRVVNITKTVKGRPYGDETLNLCELQVFSCADGFWGDQCDQQCGQCEGQEECDKVTGHCTRCGDFGLQPPFCLQLLPQPTGPDTLLTGSGRKSAAAYLLSGALAVAASMTSLP